MGDAEHAQGATPDVSWIQHIGTYLGTELTATVFLVQILDADDDSDSVLDSVSDTQFRLSSSGMLAATARQWPATRKLGGWAGSRFI